MSCKPAGFAQWRYVVPARIFMFVVGCSALAWGAIVFPAFWQQSSLERIARHIVDGDPFKVELLTDLIPAVEAAERIQYCRPVIRQSAALIRLRIAEETIASGERKLVDSHMSSLRDSVLRSLACSPADAFLWVVLFWVESRQNGFRSSYVSYLRMSYRLGPNEGWIGLKRNRIAFSVFERLPPDLREAAVKEFVTLLDSGFVRETAAVFVGPAWPVRNTLLPRLTRVMEARRKAFANLLYTEGYAVDVPSIERPDPRPWH
jgi:hypothetical protein